MQRTRNSRTKRQRRPGGLWTIWRVVGRDKTTNRPKAIGFLVTEGESVPRPVAFCNGNVRSALKQAQAIDRDHRKARAAATDFTAAPVPGSAGAMVDFLLYPLDRAGRRIGNSRELAAGQFICLKIDGQERIGFRSMQREALEMLLAQQKSGAPQTLADRDCAPNVARRCAAAA